MYAFSSSGSYFFHNSDSGSYSGVATSPVVLQPLRWCCNLSGGVALIVWFTTNGMCAKNTNICMWREQSIIEWSRRVISIVACCHGAQLCAHAARDFRSQHWNPTPAKIVDSCQIPLRRPGSVTEVTRVTFKVASHRIWIWLTIRLMTNGSLHTTSVGRIRVNFLGFNRLLAYLKLF